MGIANIKSGNNTYPISPLVFDTTERVVGKFGNVDLVSKMADITSSVSIQTVSHDDGIAIIATEPEMANYNKAFIRFIKFTNSDNEELIITDNFDKQTISSVDYYTDESKYYDFIDGKTITEAIMGYIKLAEEPDISL